MTVTYWLLVVAVGLLLASTPFYIRRAGDAAIILAGADPRELTTGRVDRTYFVGLGMAVLLTATISTLGLTTASAIAFHVPARSPALFLLGAVYFVLILGFDRWMVGADQTTGFAKERGTATGTALAWVGHFFEELVRISPRVLIALLSSWLFASFLLLSVFATEVGQQLDRLQVQEESRLAIQLASEAQAQLDKATAEKKALQDDFDTGTRAIGTANAAVQAAEATGPCTTVPSGYYATDSQTKLRHWVTTYSYSCPPATQAALNTLNSARTQYPDTQATVDLKKLAVDTKYDVADLQKTVRDAPSVAKKIIESRREDGLMARMRALDLLSTKPKGVCPLNPSTQDLANNPACVSLYSKRAAALQEKLRLWLLALEMAPVIFKFINALLPRRGYAWAMAARDAEVRERSQERIAASKARTVANLAVARHRNQVRVEVEGATAERRIRETARQARRFALPWIRAQFERSMAEVAGGGRLWRRELRVLELPRPRDGRSRGGASRPPASLTPSRRVIDSEDDL